MDSSRHRELQNEVGAAHSEVTACRYYRKEHLELNSARDFKKTANIAPFIVGWNIFWPLGRGERLGDGGGVGVGENVRGGVSMPPDPAPGDGGSGENVAGARQVLVGFAWMALQ